MKKALVAGVCASAASVTNAFDIGKSWNKWYYGLDYRIREGEVDSASTKTIFSDNRLDTGEDTDNNQILWQIQLRSIVNEDTGESILILTHILKGRILYADTLQFDVRFTTNTDDNTIQSVIDYDHVRCAMQNDVRNTAYWEVTVTDGYYPFGTDSTSTDDLVVSDNNGALSNAGQDWFVEEDDLYRDDNLCTPPTGDESWT